MEKEFIDYEIALELKELGFDEPCFGWWFTDDEMLIIEKSKKSTSENIIQAPTYSQSFRWFREKHNLVFNFMSYSIVKPGEYHWSITWNDEAKAGGIVKTYEEAELACLVKLIEIVKEK